MSAPFGPLPIVRVVDELRTQAALVRAHEARIGLAVGALRWHSFAAVAFQRDAAELLGRLRHCAAELEGAADHACLATVRLY